MSSSTTPRPNAASMIHAIAEEFGITPEQVGVIRKERKLRKKADIRHAVQEWIANEADRKAKEGQPEARPSANGDAPAPAPKKEKKAGLTLSQRRALLRLLDGDQTPATDFKALPYLKLVSYDYAVAVESTEEDGMATYTLTAKGRERAETINPGYRDWSAGETVAGDESRPVHGTWRSEKAQRDAEKAKADAEAAAKAAAEKAAADAAKAEAEAKEPKEPKAPEADSATGSEKEEPKS